MSISGWSTQRVIFLKLGYDYSILAKNGLLNTEYDREKRSMSVFSVKLMTRIRFIRIIFIKFYTIYFHGNAKK